MSTPVNVNGYIYIHKGIHMVIYKCIYVDLCEFMHVLYTYIFAVITIMITKGICIATQRTLEIPCKGSVVGTQPEISASVREAP